MPVPETDADEIEVQTASEDDMRPAPAYGDADWLDSVLDGITDAVMIDERMGSDTSHEAAFVVAVRAARAHLALLSYDQGGNGTVTPEHVELFLRGLIENLETDFGHDVDYAVSYRPVD